MFAGLLIAGLLVSPVACKKSACEGYYERQQLQLQRDEANRRQWEDFDRRTQMQEMNDEIRSLRNEIERRRR